MIKNIIKGIIYAPGVIFMSWFLASYVEVVCKNLGEVPLSFWNLFSIFS